MSKILLLNSSYEPLEIIDYEHAILLILSDKAEVIHSNPFKYIRSVYQTYYWPEVIRLNRFVNFSKRFISPSKKNIFERDNYQCMYCGSRKHLTIDHIIPKIKGGDNSFKNLVTCCETCNKKKGDRNLKDFLKETGYNFKNPSNPNFLMLYKNYCEKYNLKSWKPYIFN